MQGDEAEAEAEAGAKAEAETEAEGEEADADTDAEAVTHPSTNAAKPCLTSVITRQLVHTRRHGGYSILVGKITVINYATSVQD